MADPSELLEQYATERTTWNRIAEEDRLEAPKAFAALRAVLDVHQYGEYLSADICTGCGDDDLGDGDYVLWPCPTVQAITRELSKP